MIVGANGASAIRTLVERTTRLFVLVKMATRGANVAASAFAGDWNTVAELNDRQRKTLRFVTPKEAFSRLLAELNKNLEIKIGVAFAT